MMLLKLRARKAVFNARHTRVSLAPHGIGGMIDGNGHMTEAVSIGVDNFTLHISMDEFDAIVTRIKETRAARRELRK